VLLGITAGLSLVVQAALLVRYGFDPLWVVELFPAIAALYFAVGLIAWWRRPDNRIGPLLIVGGLAMAVAGLANIAAPLPIALGTAFATLILAVVVHLLHAFPSGRVPDRLGRATVVAGYVLTLVIYAPQYLFFPGPPDQTTILQIQPDEAIWNASRFAGRWGLVLIASVTAAVMLRRVLAAPSRQRPGLAIVYLIGILAALGPMLAVTLLKVLGFDPLQIVTTQLTFLALVPPVVGIAMLSGEFGRVGGVEPLVAAAGEEASTPEALERALASALGDRSVRLSLEPRPASLAPDRGTIEVRRGDRVAATIEYDAIQFPDGRAVSSAASLVGVILERDQLAAELREHEAELLRSRERVVEASDAERRRVARDLHDGLQAKLVLLALHAQRASDDPTLVQEVHAAIDDLRALIAGVMPPVLLERGLPTAISELSARSPVPVDLDLRLDGAQLAPAVETTAYFVVAEAMTNALKHADPTRLTIALARTNGAVRLAVGDDGRGGANSDGLGQGLTNLQDRIAALGGSLRVDSPSGAGTTVIAELPCAS
jgi:signal transduction histidine kinase